MREAHASCEQAWNNSALADPEFFKTTTLWIVHQIRDQLRYQPATPILVELAMCIEAMLRLEDVEPFSPNWPVIEEDAGVAVEFRKALTRRKRWALNADAQIGMFCYRIVSGFMPLLNALPESCFEDWEIGVTPAFSVPLISIIDRPGAAIDSLYLLPYDDDTLKLEIFLKLRVQLVTNALVASGFPLETNPHEVANKIIGAASHRTVSPAALAELYLAGTPFQHVASLPVPFRIPDAIRFEHCHIIGGTGHGKTQLMQRMIHDDLVKARDDGRCVIVIDSQGDLINKLVRLDLFSPEVLGSLADRLILIDPADVEYPAALNLFDLNLARLEQYRPADRERVLNGVIELYETFFGALLGAELTQKQGVIFRYLARLMMVIPDATIYTLIVLMDDGAKFRPYMAELHGSARYFFEKEFFHPSFSATKKQIAKRLWGVLSTPAFERMFAQKDNKLDLFAAMNDGKIILVNTAKDLLKTDGSALFGRFFISMLAQAALERSTLSESKRTATFVYVDEAQEYFDDTIETILSQARKYNVGITMAHQTLDQLTPRLRSAFLSNTSLKCVGGVSSKDARALASELHTTSEFIEGMRRRRDTTEFAVWLKHRTPEAISLSVSLGYVERQPTLTEEAYDALLSLNRARYCGTLDDVLSFGPNDVPSAKQAKPAPPHDPVPEEVVVDADRDEIEPQLPTVEPDRAPPVPRVITPRPPIEEREQGKGGPKHRYLQSLVKELAETQGFKATIEAPLASGTGQVDVLLERDDMTVAVEVSVTTPADYEAQNVRKCLSAGYDRIAVVLAKTSRGQSRYEAVISEGLSKAERACVTFLNPEQIIDYIAALAPATLPADTVVRGYKLKMSEASVPPDEAKARRDQLAKMIARSMRV